MPERCPVCDQEARRIFTPLTVLNRQKPGTTSAFLDRGLKSADGKASVLAGLRAAEQIGGDHWRKVKGEMLSSELKEIRRYKVENHA